MLLYCGEDPKLQQSTLFYINLFWRLMTMGRERGVEIVPYIDPRAESQRVLRPPELDCELAAGSFDGVIGMMMFDRMTAWMKEARLPYSVMIESDRSLIVMDYHRLIRDSFTRLAELGCDSVGLMFPAHLVTADVLELVDEMAQTLHLEVKYEWILVARQSQEINGYNHFLSLWDLKTRPKGLVIYPDETARGVISAILEQQVQVPGEMKLVLHRNAESPYVVPFPCDWLENSVDTFAEALYGNLEDQWAGKAPSKRVVPFQLIHGY